MPFETMHIEWCALKYIEESQEEKKAHLSNVLTLLQFQINCYDVKRYGNWINDDTIFQNEFIFADCSRIDVGSKCTWFSVS